MYRDKAFIHNSCIYLKVLRFTTPDFFFHDLLMTKVVANITTQTNDLCLYKSSIGLHGLLASSSFRHKTHLVCLAFPNEEWCFA